MAKRHVRTSKSPLVPFDQIFHDVSADILYVKTRDDMLHPIEIPAGRIEKPGNFIFFHQPRKFSAKVLCV
ncbi:MAG: hypothetical protein OXI81_04085 [Paracoccaceae bacterium]|nr:hypothetical protein [Paracoccaceae bacterium]